MGGNSNCTFKTGSDCTFKTGDNCFVIRSDIKGVTEIPQNQIIKFNGHNVPGYRVVEEHHVIIIDGKEIELSNESFNELNKSLT